MKKPTTTIVLIAVLVLLVGGGYLWLTGDADEAVINRRLSELVDLAQKQENESVFVTIGDSREIMNYIASRPHVELGVPLPLLTNRDELEGVIVQVRQTLQSLSIRILKNELVVAEDGRTAQMELEAEGNVAHLGDRGRERRHFSIGWVKEDGDWYIERIQQDQPLLP